MSRERPTPRSYLLTVLLCAVNAFGMALGGLGNGFRLAVFCFASATAVIAAVYFVRRVREQRIARKPE